MKLSILNFMEKKQIRPVVAEKLVSEKRSKSLRTAIFGTFGT